MTIQQTTTIKAL